MSLTMIQPSEKIQINQTVGLIYGLPGAGKTSMANTAKNAVTLDFDKGAQRCRFRQAVLRIDSWADIEGNVNAFYAAIEPYSTIIIDTIDTCLKYMVDYCIQKDYKLKTNNLRLYGVLTPMFEQFVSGLKLRGKDVVFVAQVKEIDEGDRRLKRPDISGTKNYGMINTSADYIGYLYYENNIRILNFNPTDEFYGKNPLQYEPIKVPDYNTEPEFFGNILFFIKNSMGQISNSHIETKKEIDEFRRQLGLINCADEMNAFIDLKSAELSKLSEGVRLQYKEAVKKRVAELLLTYDKDSKLYFDTLKIEKVSAADIDNESSVSESQEKESFDDIIAPKPVAKQANGGTRKFDFSQKIAK